MAGFQKKVKNDRIWLWLRLSLEGWMIFPGTQNWQTGPKLVSGPDDNQLIKLKSKRRFQSWRLWISYKISQFSKVVAGRPEALLGFFNRINNQFSMNWTNYMWHHGSRWTIEVNFWFLSPFGSIFRTSVILKLLFDLMGVGVGPWCKPIQKWTNETCTKLHL